MKKKYIVTYRLNREKYFSISMLINTIDTRNHKKIDTRKRTSEKLLLFFHDIVISANKLGFLVAI